MVQRAPAVLAKPDQSPSGTIGSNVHLHQEAHLCSGAHVRTGDFFTTQHGSQSWSWHVSSCSLSPLIAQLRLCVAKKRATCPTCDVKVPYSVSHFGSSRRYCMCEHCHVLHCKWLMLAVYQGETQSDWLYLAGLSFLTIDCCLPEEVKAHWWIICRTLPCEQVNFVKYHFLPRLQSQIKRTLY